jgi:HEAT repeat protein
MPVNAQTSLSETVDSLFVIASSGELRFRDMVEPAKEQLADLGTPAVPLLIDKFTTKSARERWTVLDVLKKIGSPAVPDLVHALSRPDGLVVQRVCWALGDIGDTAAVMPLITACDHSRWHVRDQAVGALGKIGDHRADSVVAHTLTDSVGQVRKSAAVSAGKLGLDAAVRILTGMLGDDFYGARMNAFEALQKLDSAAVEDVLIDSLASPNNLTGDLVCALLGRLGTDRALAALRDQARHADPDRRAHAGAALVTADPHDNCGFHHVFLDNETDRLVRLRITAALEAALDDLRPTQ